MTTALIILGVVVLGYMVFRGAMAQARRSGAAEAREKGQIAAREAESGMADDMLADRDTPDDIDDHRKGEF